VRDLEKNFFARELKIVLQHNRVNSGTLPHVRNGAFDPEPKSRDVR
jgi:hypothetical protein